ncbi:glycoside hydrolase family protein [Roseibium alexandrii]|uniref:Lysozyme n=1 Tax=Roseibium alexandrii (strain DSM 17067 / NCIMB 14079 / DFL-11) TaxID=244592 RepID=A0A5E8H1Q8_ROSAD|nr:VWA domain-containing protein [Roseibium alexandrii]EEE46366.2 Phage-related lysozyme (muraminidase) [Roseibium alexandrii DFL-11]
MNTYSISAQGTNFIKQFETGLDSNGNLLPQGQPALVAYLDDSNVWTIGWGHTRGVQPGDTITLSQAEDLLSQDIESIVGPELTLLANAHDAIGCTLQQHQIDAVASLIFNAGSLRANGPGSWQALLEGNFDTFLIEASEIRNGRKDGELVPFSGLEDRRADEAEMFVKADYSRTFDNSAGNPGSKGNPYAPGNYLGNKSNPQGIPADWQVSDCQGQSVALVIDLSGSMGNDLASVKSSALELINAIFGTDAAPVASRLGIVTFNNTDSIQIVLPFTEQANISDRKSAAIDAINGLAILGGGAEPLNGALLTALRGDIGSWRTGTNKIIVFTDEPAADPELRDDVITLANDLGVQIPQQQALPIDLAPAANDGSVVSVQILPVLIGGGSSARSDLEELASRTGGQLFQSTNAAESAAVLIGAIQSTSTVTDGDDIFTIVTGIARLDGQKGTDVVTISSNLADVSLSTNRIGEIVLEDNDGTSVILENIEFVLANDGMIMVAPPERASFDEAFYLSLYSDVASAVGTSGGFESGLAHYLQLGIFEGRLGAFPFNEEFYLNENEDILAAVQAGSFSSGKEHFILHGMFEGRDPVSLFDTEYYLDQNSDVEAAVTAGAITAYQHYLLSGSQEGRRPSNLFSEGDYYSVNQDVAVVGIDAFIHFYGMGVAEGRSISDPDLLGL